MIQILAIPSAHRFLVPAMPHVVPRMKTMGRTLGRGWTPTADNRVMGQYDSWGDVTSDTIDPSTYYDSTSSDIMGPVDPTTMDNNATDTLSNVATDLLSQGVSAAVLAAQKALGITPVYHPGITLHPTTTLPKWLIPAGIGAAVLIFAMSGKKKS